MSETVHRPERALVHPLWLASLVLLIVNDHFFKGAGVLHEIATGKLSDVVGLIVAPALLTTLLRGRTRRHLAVAHVAVGAVFASIQISPSFANAVAATMTTIGVPWRLWPDLTDLLTLPALWLSWSVLVPAMTRPVAGSRRLVQLGKLTAGTVGLLACVGTSSQAPPHVPEVAPPPPAVAATAVVATETPAPRSRDLSSLVGHRWRASNADGSWQLTYHFHADGTYTAVGQPSWHESGRVAVISATPDRVTLRLSERRYDGREDETADRTLEFDASGASFVLNGDRFHRVEHVVNVAIEDDVETDDVP